MPQQLSIGSAKHNQIIIKDSLAKPVQAIVNYSKGKWVLENLDLEVPIYVNKHRLSTPQELQKYDTISIGQQIIHWQDYLYEGDAQELNLADIQSIHGRISRSNYRVLSLLFIGLIISIFFLPGLIGSIYVKLFDTASNPMETVQLIAPYIHLIGFVLLSLTFLLLSVKRMRDTGHPIWKILLPIYNLKLLYFGKSKT